MTRILLLAALMLGLLTTPASARINGVWASSAADKATLQSVGFNAATTNPYVSDLDNLAAHGLKGVVWLQGYVNEPTCQFLKDDVWLTAKVNAIKSHPALLAYHVDDEPHGAECPNAPAQIKARTALLHKLDPNHPVVLSHYRDYEFAQFAGSADILAVVAYPCSHTYGCRYSKITDKVQIARDGGWSQLWSMPQTFGDDYYRMPTLAEEQQILSTWDAAGVTDRFTYTWDKTDPDTLSMHPDVWQAFASEFSAFRSSWG